MSGWVKLHRSLLDWQWYDDINATRLLIHLLVSVNHKDKKWRGITVKAGSMILSWNTLSEGCGLSIKQCRVAMQKLENSQEVARSVASKYQVVSLIKWDKLQGEDDDMAVNRAGKGQAKGRQRATTKECKERKECKESFYRQFDHLKLTDEEFQKLLETYPKQKIDEILDRIQNYAGNKKYKSLYLTANNWLRKEFETNKNQEPTSISRQRIPTE